MNFREKPNWQFDAKDMTVEALPAGYDLIHCRDALQHLSCTLIVDALHNMVRSGAKYLVVGSYDDPVNTNIQSGDYFSLNLWVAPFNLSSPDHVYSEDTPGEPNKLQLLYRLSEIGKHDFDAMKRGCELL